MDWRLQYDLKTVGSNIRDKGKRIETCDNAYHLGILRDELAGDILRLNTYIRQVQEYEAS